MRFQQSYQIGNSTLRIRLGDIADARTEVVVTSDDSQLSMGGGTSQAIRKAAGESVYQMSRALTPVALGHVVHTTAGDLSKHGVRYIFHAATIPSAAEREVADPGAVVRRATRQALAQLESLQLTSIALPALGTGFAKFDASTVAVAMSEIIREHLQQSTASLDVEIWLKLGTKNDLAAVTFLSDFTVDAHLGEYAERSHAVVLVHGIRTAQGWRERIGAELEQGDRSLTPIPIGYGFFDVISFLLPIGPLRRRAAETVWRKMKPLFDSPNIDRVSVVAHSFGTWIVGYLLEKKPVHFHRVVLCGAILDTDYSWAEVQRKIDHPNYVNARAAFVVNDCGTKDFWPIFAKFATWGYGSSGRLGFQNALAKDRFHVIGHGGFFEEGFATRFWLPALTQTTLPMGTHGDVSPPYLLNVLTVLKLPVLLAIAIGIGLYWLAR